MQPHPLIYVLAHSCGVEWNGLDRNNVANKAKSGHSLMLKKYLLSGSEYIYLLSVLLELHFILFHQCPWVSMLREHWA